MPILRPPKRALKKKIKNRHSDIAPTGGTISGVGSVRTLGNFSSTSTIVESFHVDSFTVNGSSDTCIVSFLGTSDERLARATRFQKEFRKRSLSWLVDLSAAPAISVRVGDFTIGTTLTLSVQSTIIDGAVQSINTGISIGLTTQYLEVG